MKLFIASGRRFALPTGITKVLFLFPALVLLVLVVHPERVTAQEPSDPPLLQVEPFRENLARRARRAESTTNYPTEVLRTARYVYVRSLSALVTAEDIENKLRKHPDFQRYGMVVTRMESDADVILEVRRSILTKFVFTAIDPTTLIVGSSGKLSSLGGTVDGKVASLFMKQVVAAHQK
jgi:hypothetical protein